MPRENLMVGNRAVPVNTLADRFITDSELIEDGDSEQQFYVTRQNKPYHLANFEGDYSLVPEGHVFKVIAHLICVLHNADAAANAQTSMIDAVELWEQGYVDWQIQGTTTDRVNMRYMAGGFDFIAIDNTVSGLDGVRMGTGDHANCRRYELEKIVPGGRSIDYYLRWNGGVTLAVSQKVQVALYGIQSQLV